MTDITDDPRFPQFPDGRFPVMGYLTLSPDAMRACECRVSQRILAWLSTCDRPYYRDYIALVTEDAFNSKFMMDLAFGIWRHSEASMWLSWHDAPGSSSLLWQYSILRAAQLLQGEVSS